MRQTLIQGTAYFISADAVLCKHQQMQNMSVRHPCILSQVQACTTPSLTAFMPLSNSSEKAENLGILLVTCDSQSETSNNQTSGNTHHIVWSMPVPHESNRQRISYETVSKTRTNMPGTISLLSLCLWTQAKVAAADPNLKSCHVCFSR